MSTNGINETFNMANRALAGKKFPRGCFENFGGQLVGVSVERESNRDHPAKDVLTVTVYSTVTGSLLDSDLIIRDAESGMILGAERSRITDSKKKFEFRFFELPRGVKLCGVELVQP